MSRRLPRQRPQRRAPWAAYLWPGLPHLWVRGSWWGLALAVGFTALTHTTVLATLVWPAWLAPRTLAACGVTLGLLWVAALWETRGELRRLAAEREIEQSEQAGGADEPVDQAGVAVDSLLVEAQTLYLRADWVATERKLLELLRLDRDDAEAHLLLATLWRRTGRLGDARRRLRRLARRESAEGWRFEIDAELRLCASGVADDAAPSELGDEPQPAEPGAEPTPRHETPETLQLTEAGQPDRVRTDRKAA